MCQENIGVTDANLEITLIPDSLLILILLLLNELIHDKAMVKSITLLQIMSNIQFIAPLSCLVVPVLGMTRLLGRMEPLFHACPPMAAIAAFNRSLTPVLDKSTFAKSTQVRCPITVNFSV